MTYLELVNKVLVRLREDTVSTVGESAYSSLVGEFVNDAKEFIENAWDWSALRQTITIPTTASDYTYSLTGAGQFSEVKTVTNDTANTFMAYRDQDWFEQQLYINGSVEGVPVNYTYNGIDGSGDSQVMVYPIPDDVYSLRFKTILRTGLLSSDSDTIKIPTMPVIHLATAFAARERGETGGTAAAELFGIADRSLSDAIALDSSRHPEELVYVAV